MNNTEIKLFLEIIWECLLVKSPEILTEKTFDDNITHGVYVKILNISIQTELFLVSENNFPTILEGGHRTYRKQQLKEYVKCLT